MNVIVSSPLLSYLSYELLASDGWLEGFFIGSVSSHGRMEEGFISQDSLFNAVRITSFSRISPYSPAIESCSVPENAIGWFRYRNNSTQKRVSIYEMTLHLKLGGGIPSFLFCLPSRELKGDFSLTMALNFSFFTITAPSGSGRKPTIEPVQILIANPDDSAQPSYPMYQIEHAFSIPWSVPDGNSSESKPRDSFKRAVSHSIPVEVTVNDPSPLMVDYSKAAFAKMLDRLTAVSSRVQNFESLIDFEG